MARVMNRRKYLSGTAVVGISSVSGCLGVLSENDKDSDGDGTQDEYDDYPEDSSRNELIREYQSTALFQAEHRYRESFMQTRLTFDFELKELNDRKINVEIFTDEEYKKLVNVQGGNPIVSQHGISEITDSFSIPGSFDGHVDGINFILSRANTDLDWCRVYFNREIYR